MSIEYSGNAERSGEREYFYVVLTIQKLQKIKFQNYYKDTSCFHFSPEFRALIGTLCVLCQGLYFVFLNKVATEGMNVAVIPRQCIAPEKDSSLNPKAVSV